MEVRDYILVVDDSPTQALQMQMLLENAKYRVGVAEDGVDAMRMVRANHPDLVVTDLEMPNKNGLEVVEEIKQEFPSLPVVLTTGKGSEDIAADALRSTLR